jgi:hypothetical protein
MTSQLSWQNTQTLSLKIGNIFCRGLIYKAHIRKIYGCFKKIETQVLAEKR